MNRLCSGWGAGGDDSAQPTISRLGNQVINPGCFSTGFLLRFSNSVALFLKLCWEQQQILSSQISLPVSVTQAVLPLLRDADAPWKRWWHIPRGLPDTSKLGRAACHHDTCSTNAGHSPLFMCCMLRCFAFFSAMKASKAPFTLTSP